MAESKKRYAFPGFAAVSDQVFVRDGEDLNGKPLPPKQPRVVIIYAWGDAIPKHLAKYADGFRELFPHAKQIAVLSPIFQTMRLNLDQRTEKMLPVVKAAFPPASQDSTDPDEDSVLVHVMSNTGGINYAATLNAYKQYLNRPLPHRLSILDSTPGSVVLTRENLQRWSYAMALGTAGWFPWPFIVTQCIWGVFLCANRFIEHIIGRESAPLFSVRAMVNEELKQKTVKTLFLYSKEDQLISWSDIETNIADSILEEKDPPLALDSMVLNDTTPGTTGVEAMPTVRSTGPGGGDRTDDATTDAQQPGAVTGVSSLAGRALIIVSLGVAAFLCALDATIVATLMPTLADEFNSVTNVGWYGSVYLLVTGATQPLLGKLYTMFNPKTIFVACIGLLGGGSLICALAMSSPMFIGGRAMAGLGGAGILSGALIITAIIIPLHQRAVYTGIIGALECVALAVGPVIGGAIAGSIGWQWCFWINLPIGAALSAALLFFFNPPMPSSPASSASEQGYFRALWEVLRKLDLIGATAITGSLFCLSLALQWGGTEYAWNDGRIIALLVVFAISFACVGVHHYFAGENAIFPIRLLRNKAFVASLFNAFCFGSGQYAILYYLPTWFQAVRGESAIDAGVRMLPLAVAIIGASVTAGIGILFVGYLPPFVMTATALAAIGSGLMHTVAPTMSQAQVIGFQILYGSGTSIGVQQSFIGAQAALKGSEVAYATSAVMLANSMGGVISICISQNVFMAEIVALARVLRTVDRDTLERGFESVRKILSPEELEIAIQGYNRGVQDVFLVAIIFCCATALSWPFLSWASVKPKGRRHQEDVCRQEADSSPEPL
ncbi:hypothetical protein QQZ08_009253 [Neonectria magnoliae]|uniref:Major facilitator superfamily (MFS) profile domain-containing protein n=1 Tax=Neonectria magnoliae TaxID=2732573 RepID=A0ABR1HPI9_9HYPO